MIEFHPWEQYNTHFAGGALLFYMRLFMRLSLCTLNMEILVWMSCCSVEQDVLNTEKKSTGGTFKMALSSSPETLDPQRILFYRDRQVAALIYEGLVGYGEELGAIRPLIAESWEELDGGRRWIFKIRQNVFFQDDPCFPQGKGRKLVPEDIVYTFERMAGNETVWYLLANKIEGIDEYTNKRAAAISGITILDDRHIQIQLTKPFVSFLKILASHTAYIVPREAVAYYGEHFGEHPVGTGPFHLVRWRPLQGFLLVKNKNYWRRSPDNLALPYLDAITIRLESSLSQVFSEFLKGESHLLEANERLFRNLKKETLHPDLLHVAAVSPGVGIRFFGFSLDTDSPFHRNKSLRKAVAMAFNRNELSGKLSGVNFLLSTSLSPPFFLNNPKNLWHAYNPQNAKEIFSQYRPLLDGRPIHIASNLEYPSVKVLLKSLAQCGPAASIQVHSLQYHTFIATDRPDLFRVSFIPSFPDPEEYFSLFYSKKFSGY